jgi:hypothetical protein
VNATGRFTVRFFNNGTTLAPLTLIEHWLLLKVTAVPGATGEDQAVPASLRKYNWFVAPA